LLSALNIRYFRGGELSDLLRILLPNLKLETESPSEGIYRVVFRGEVKSPIIKIKQYELDLNYEYKGGRTYSLKGNGSFEGKLSNLTLFGQLELNYGSTSVKPQDVLARAKAIKFQNFLVDIHLDLNLSGEAELISNGKRTSYGEISREINAAIKSARNERNKKVLQDAVTCSLNTVT